MHVAFKDQRFWTDMFLAQSLKTGAYRGDEPTIGLDYYGSIFQMFRAAPVSDAYALDSTHRPSPSLQCEGFSLGLGLRCQVLKIQG